MISNSFDFEVLQVKADELEAQQAQCFALAQLEQYSQLLEVLPTASQIPKDQIVFQKAYCLYRLQRHSEALKLIAGVPQPSQALRHLEAQAVRPSLSLNRLLYNLKYLFYSV
jgi:signal recognition particle subunit SRP72